MPSERLKRIIEENQKFEKMSPYNFCDRWCERCPHQTQLRCQLYLDEQERQLTCIAHGREEDDQEVTEQVLDWQYAPMNEMMEAEMEEIDLDTIDDSDFGADKERVEFFQENSLAQTADQYRKKAQTFLEATFYEDEEAFDVGDARDLDDVDDVDEEAQDMIEDGRQWSDDLIYDFETISWYHTLLPVKLHRALSSFTGLIDDDISLRDTVAQFAICKKGAAQSLEALRKIAKSFPEQQRLTAEMIALLQNISSRIEIMETEI